MDNPPQFYRIVENFQGVQFLRISYYPRNKYDCTVHNGHDCVHPRKLNFEDCPVKIGSREISYYYYGI